MMVLLNLTTILTMIIGLSHQKTEEISDFFKYHPIQPDIKIVLISRPICS